MKKRLISLILILCMVIVSGISYTKTSAKLKKTKDTQITEPYLSQETVTCEIGDKFKIKLKGAKAASYSIDDETVAKVSEKGKVKTKRAGSAILTVTDKEGRNYTCLIKVYDTKRQAICITQPSENSKATSKIQAKDVPSESFKVKPGMLVNFTNILYNRGTPKGLIYLKDSDVTKRLSYRDYDCRLQKEIIAPLSDMLEDAYKEGKHKFGIIAGGGYRAYETQDRYWQRRLSRVPTYGDDPYHNGVECVPGVSSEHRTGYAVDFETTPQAFEWLAENSYKYGFIKRYSGEKTIITGVMEENWHFTYVGKAVAATCYYEGLCLEEYYEKYVYVNL